MLMKNDIQDVSITEAIAEILSLQKKYSSENTEEMQTRGNLIRRVLPEIFSKHSNRFSPNFTKAGYVASIEGKDGIGRKSMSAWVRIFDKEMSPSATQGWYIVIHFSSKGDYFYLTLGCGATIFKGGSLVDVDDITLMSKISWAKNCFQERPELLSRYSDKISLHGNHLSTQFEKAIAFAKRYCLENFNDILFWEDVTELSHMLTSIYESERLGKAPLSEAPEIREFELQVMQTVSPNRKSGRGQGRFLNQQEKKTVELHAMTIVATELERLGFTKIKDESANKSYDFSAKKK